MRQQEESFSMYEEPEQNFNSNRFRKKKAVYTIIELEGGKKDYWLRLGTALVNRDDSLTVFLNALPVNNQLHIRDLPEGK